MREQRDGEGTKDKSKPLLRRRRRGDQKLESREEEEEDVFAQREMKVVRRGRGRNWDI